MLGWQNGVWAVSDSVFDSSSALETRFFTLISRSVGAGVSVFWRDMAGPDTDQKKQNQSEGRVCLSAFKLGRCCLVLQ